MPSFCNQLTCCLQTALLRKRKVPKKQSKLLHKALHNIYFLMFQLNSIEWVLMMVNMMNTFSDCPSCVLLFYCRLFANLTTHMLHPIYWRRLAIFMELSSFFQRYVCLYSPSLSEAVHDHFLLFLQTLKVKVKVLCDVFEENKSPSLNGTVIFFVRCYAITR